MASSSFSRSGAVRMFPLQLAQGVIVDILTKELDALFSPSDEAKRVVFQEAQSSLPRRMALLTSQIGVEGSGAADTGKVFHSLIIHVWKCLLNHPAIASIHLSLLTSSVWLETFSAVFKAACSISVFHHTFGEGCLLVCGAINSVDRNDVPPEAMARLPALIEWWSDEVCCKRWKVTDAWGSVNIEGVSSDPLRRIAVNGLPSLVPMALERGCRVNGSFSNSSFYAPAAIALRGGHVDVFEALLAQGADLLRRYEGDGMPLGMRVCLEARTELVADLLRKRPEIMSLTALAFNGQQSDVLCVAIRNGKTALVDLLLTLGAPVNCKAVFGNQYLTAPALAAAISVADPTILGLLITKGKALEDWRSKYDDEALACISINLARLAVEAYPNNPQFRGAVTFLPKYNPKALECLEMVLASGIVCPWNNEFGNSLLRELYPSSTAGHPQGCVVEQKNALALLKRFRAAGFDVAHNILPACDAFPERPRLLLQQLVVPSDHAEILDWDLGEVGSPLRTKMVDGVSSTLEVAMRFKGVECALLLLKKYKASAALPDEGLFRQPVVSLLRASLSTDYTDEQAEVVMRALIERDPSIFAVKSFDHESVAEAEASQRVEATESISALPWNPLYILVTPPKPRTLELVLTSNLPGVAAMANRPVLVTRAANVDESERRKRFTPTQWAAISRNWEALSLILRHTNARVTDAYDRFIPTVDIVKRQVGKPGGPPRALVAMVEARAAEELAERAKAAALTKADGATTNAFEDLAVKPLTEKEEKKKAKKKAAKKKAKAKKRAACTTANAGAGASPRDDDASSSDGEDKEEEPDDNLVDSRNAPSLDLMLERMGLKGDGANASSGK